MDRLLLALSNDGRVAYATADGDAFHVGPIQGGAASRVEAEDINDLAWCGELLLVCTKDGLVRIRHGDAWAYTLKVSEEAGAISVAPGATVQAPASSPNLSVYAHASLCRTRTRPSVVQTSNSSPHQARSLMSSASTRAAAPPPTGPTWNAYLSAVA